jgi:3,4-dihydroxy 2-butanone 4-phosphate synthase/GTP cyclohydrolase II
MRVFTDQTQGAEHIVLTMGDLGDPAPVLVRMHSMNPLEDVLGIGAGHAGDLRGAMRLIAAEGRGVVVLLRDTQMKLLLDDAASPQTLRQYGLGAQILAALGLHQITLVTNSPTPRVVGLDAYGLNIAGTRPIPKE